MTDVADIDGSVNDFSRMTDTSTPMRLDISRSADRWVTATLNEMTAVLTAPSLTLEGRRVACALSAVMKTATRELEHGVTETRHTGPLADAPSVSLTVVVRQRRGSPFARFRYELNAESSCRIEVNAETQPEYLRLAVEPDARVMAVRLGEFEESVHSYHLTEHRARAEAFAAGLDEAGPLAANWIRAAVDTIAERELRSGGKLPAEALEQFVLDRNHAPQGRRLAYEWLRRVDRTAPNRLIPGMLDDPSLEMRRDAITRLIRRAESLSEAEKADEATTIYEKAMAAARDIDQIKLLADRLKKLDRPVDLARHFGFLMTWKVVGPFDNMDEKGFDRVYPPEKELDTKASYEGKHGEVRWVDHVTTDPYGKVDLNKILGEEKGVAAYAVTEFISPERREVQFRTTTFSAVKLWLNGRLIDQHKVYHGGSELDQYVCTAVLEPGRNVILIKACQNEQTQSWAKVWGFQLRVCDTVGTAVLSTDRDQ